MSETTPGSRFGPLRAVSNVVIDVVVGGLALTNDAGRIADAIAANVST